MSPDKMFVSAQAQRICFDDYMIQGSSLQFYMNRLCGIEPEALELTFDARKDLFREPVNIRHSSGRRGEYTQQHFLMREAEFVYPQRDDKAEFRDISALKHN